MAAAHLSLKRLSSFSRSWIALCFTFDWSRSLSAASILQVLVSGGQGWQQRTEGAWPARAAGGRGRENFTLSNLENLGIWRIWEFGEFRKGRKCAVGRGELTADDT